MILVDSSIWIDHLRAPDALLTAISNRRRQCVHPFVIAEVALGSLKDRRRVIALLQRMPQARVATHDEVLWLIDGEALHGTGIGYVDAHLLASAKLMPGAQVWTRDRRLAAACAKLDLSFEPPR